MPTLQILCVCEKLPLCPVQINIYTPVCHSVYRRVCVCQHALGQGCCIEMWWYRRVSIQGGGMSAWGCQYGGVCLGVSVSMGGGVCPEGRCLSRGVCLGVSVQGGVCPQGGCLSRGCLPRGRLHASPPHAEMVTAVVGMHPTGMNTSY